MPEALPSLDALISQVDAADPYADGLPRLAEAAARAQALRDLAYELVGHFVDRARDEGASWKDIGQVLGVTKQAAQQRFGGDHGPLAPGQDPSPARSPRLGTARTGSGART